jgi:hypothetical protein
MKWVARGAMRGWKHRAGSSPARGTKVLAIYTLLQHCTLSAAGIEPNPADRYSSA